MTNIRLAKLTDIEELSTRKPEHVSYTFDRTKYWVIVPAPDTSIESPSSKKLDWLRKLRNGDNNIIVSTYDNQITATATLKSFRTNQKLHSKVTDFITFSRDMNTANDILSYLILKAKNELHESITIEVSKENKKSCSLVEKHGFVEDESNEKSKTFTDKKSYYLKLTKS